MNTTREQAADEALTKKIELHRAAQHITLGCLGSELRDLEAAALRYAAAYLELHAARHNATWYESAVSLLSDVANNIGSLPEAS